MMKQIRYIVVSCILPVVLLAVSCTDYLSIPVEAEKSTEDVFGDYYNFQGYVDRLYTYLQDPIGLTMDVCYAGETVSTTSWTTGYNSVRGNYRQYMTRGYLSNEPTYDKGIWYDWEAIRAANVGLMNFDLMKGTEEEKNLIKGQLLFFRGYYHQELLAAWGTIPYIDEVLVDEFERPRFVEYEAKDGKTYQGYQACAVKAAEDLQAAADLLPVAWDNSAQNLGRCTKMTALAYKARTLLYAASPLMSEYSGLSVTDRKPAEVNTELMKLAAEAASEAIKISLDNPTLYNLVDWEHYSDMFYSTDGITAPGTIETIWSYHTNAKGTGNILNKLGRVHLPQGSLFGGNAVNNTVTQNYVDLFEMKDGSLYKPEYDGITTGSYEAGTQKCKMWDERDPRFRRAVYVDRDLAGFKETTRLQLYNGGSTRQSDNCLSPYYIHKFWAPGANKADNGTEYQNFMYVVPYLRLAEIYLVYAEAVNEALGDPNQKVGPCGLTALEAVNRIRTRATHVPTDAKGGAHGSFRKMILNERAVELCFEGQYWYDIRRYKIGETMSKEAIQTLDFTKEWTNFARRTLLNRTFDTPKHYWMPFPTNLTKMYSSFPQNIGWE